MNLAAWNYRNILSRDGGPIEEVAVREIAADDTRLGRKCFEALAYLRPNLLPNNPKSESPGRQLYGSAHGTGTAFNKLDAIHKAVSEALERWAFYDLSASSDLDISGLNIDSGTNGFAAFPGLLDREAKQNANFEALERWSICAWWEGYLKSAISSRAGLTVIALQPAEHATTVIVSSCDPHCLDDTENPSFYGFATSSDFDRAYMRAVIELERNHRVISVLSPAASLKANMNLNPLDSRLLWFANSEGKDAFSKVAVASSKMRKNALTPELVFDKKIPGPWSKYATVWRTLYKPVSEAAGGSRRDYFFF